MWDGLRLVPESYEFYGMVERGNMDKYKGIVAPSWSH